MGDIKSDYGMIELCIAVINQSIRDYSNCSNKGNSFEKNNIKKFLEDNIFVDLIELVTNRNNGLNDYIISRI